MLYFTNSFGAAVGVLASGFYLIDKLGLPGTILTAGLMNVAARARRLADHQAPARRGAEAPAAAHAVAGAAKPRCCSARSSSSRSRRARPRSSTRSRGSACSRSGLGASTHSFEVMLAAFILGMSLGALVLRFRIDRLRSDTLWLAGLLVAKAVFAVVRDLDLRRRARVHPVDDARPPRAPTAATRSPRCRGWSRR